MTHQLVSQDDKQYTTRCGQTRSRSRKDPMPEDITAWGSAVTCPACLSPSHPADKPASTNPRSVKR